MGDCFTDGGPSYHPLVVSLSNHEPLVDMLRMSGKIPPTVYEMVTEME